MNFLLLALVILTVSAEFLKTGFVSESEYTYSISLTSITDAPTIAPTQISTVKPTAKPTRKPTLFPTISIYQNNESVNIPQVGQQAIVGALTILLFILMALEFLSPEVLFMIALIIVMLCQILTLGETLSGEPFFPEYLNLGCSAANVFEFDFYLKCRIFK
jgi:hypothetical protein